MADPSSSEAPKKKKKGNPAKQDAGLAAKAAAPPPAGDEGLLTTWRTWAVFGVVLIGGIVAWKLLGSSYRSDVDTICNAEKGSGFTVAKDMSKVTAYVRSHLATPEGNELFSSLTDARLPDRAKRIRDEADKQHVGACPIADAYEKLAAEGDYRADLQRLCSSVSFPKLGELEDPARLDRLEDWIDHQARSPRTKELGDGLRQQATGADRAKLLRETAGKMDVFSCDVAKTLEGPVLPSKGKGLPQVRPYAQPQINGVMQSEDLAKALALVTPQMDACYQKGLDIKPDLEGKLSVKLKIDPDGKVTSATPAENTVPERESVMCILKTMRDMKLPKNDGPLVTALVPLELTTAGVGAPSPAGSSSAAPPGATSAPSAPAASAH